MTTGEGSNPRDGQAPRDGEGRRGNPIGVGGGDDSVSRIQLAARWAEAYSPEGDSLAKVLKRFRSAFDYLDAVIHGVEPPDLDTDVVDVPLTAPAYTPAPAPQSAEPAPAPPPPSWSEPSQPEQRPWS